MQRTMQVEEIQQEWTLEALQSRLNDLKISIGEMIRKIETEYETINWPTFLDNFALLSSHLTGLTKILSRAMASQLRNLTVLPLLLSPNQDDALLQLTEGRISAFSHDMVPDYLRTKLEPTAEQRMMQHEEKANSLTDDTAKREVAHYKNMVTDVFDLVRKAREEWEISEATSRPGVLQTSSMRDTHKLVTAVGMGRGLQGIVPYVGGSRGGSELASLLVRPRTTSSSSTSAVSSSEANQTGNASSAVKTNIKPANRIHPNKR